MKDEQDPPIHPSSLRLHPSPTLRPLLRLALPVIAEQSLAMLVGLSDQVLTGWFLGEHSLAAVNLMVYVLWFLMNTFVFVTTGATAMVARFTGARDFEGANRVANQAFLLGAVLAVGGTTAGLLFGKHVIPLLGLHGESAALAERYLSCIWPVLPFMMFESVGMACLRGAGDTVTGLAAMCVTNVVNVLMSWSLVQGWGPLPEMGWDGIALGTACGFAVGGLVVLFRLLRGRAGLRLRRELLRPDPALARRILRIGIPGGADILSIVACQLWFVSIVNQLGDLAAAAHGVAIRIESIAYLPGAAFQVAATTLAGQHLGAGDPRQAKRSVVTACLAGCGGMTVMGVLFFLLAEPLTRLFVRPDQTAVIALAAPLLRIVAFCMPQLALSMILTGALRGAGDTRWPLAFTFTGYLVFRIPLAYWLTQHTGPGVSGAWYAMLVDLTVRCLLVSARFLHGGWQRVQV